MGGGDLWLRELSLGLSARGLQRSSVPRPPDPAIHIWFVNELPGNSQPAFGVLVFSQKPLGGAHLLP